MAYRHYRYPYRPRRYGRDIPPWAVPAAVGAVVLAAAGHAHATTTGHVPSTAAVVRHAGAGFTPPGGAAAKAIAYARAQLGKPYLWGGTGPGAFDCSGLVMEAWASAGVAIQRTSQGQWASERHVSTPEPGDLVFFAGGDGTTTAPGHVGIVIGANTMIEAYATGFPIRVSQFGTASSAPGDEAPVGFTDPGAQ